MDLSQGAAQIANAASPLVAPAISAPVHLAKAALRRLALDKLEPTPENYARAYAAESGQAASVLSERARPVLQRMAAQIGAPVGSRDALVKALMAGRWDEADRALEVTGADSAAHARGWADLMQRLARSLERGSRLWTAARKKESLQRVLAGGGSDALRLQHRVRQLLTLWESEVEEIESGVMPLHDGAEAAAPAPPEPVTAAPAEAAKTASTEGAAVGMPAVYSTGDWMAIVNSLHVAVQAGLSDAEPRAAELTGELAEWLRRMPDAGASPDMAAQAEDLSQRARRMLAHRQHLLDELGKLCSELTQGLTELAEDDSWARGQCEVMRSRLADGLNVRNVRAAGEVLADARKRQGALRGERNQARDALKAMIQGMLTEVGEFGKHTGRFQDNVGRHAEAIARADSLDSLAGVVREMVDDSQAVQAMVSQTQGRLQAEQARASEMQTRVNLLEDELRRLSNEVSTDALTQVANRRGLAKAFEAERQRLSRVGGNAGLAVGLIDIDNFKKLNDTLGHHAGDVALQNLAARVREQLRPHDTVARFGGEEFVVLLPDTDTAEAQQVLSRLQRRLTASLFMHENKEVFVTFSAGVTLLRDGEALEGALERADEALYEAKRTGKNRTCLG
jgi:diguanylate cyclase